MSSRISRARWVRAAERLAAALPASALHPAATRWLRAPENTGARVAVALSGGADSVALLLLLWAHFPERRSRLVALHFDHRLRGRASSADARFCAVLCAALGVTCVTGRWDKPPKPAPGGVVPEAAARAARMAFFTAALRRRRVDALCTGHHRDDVAETLLMRLARGSGAAGLAAPRPVHVQAALGRVHLRPLLDLDKAALVSALGEAGARWREDASNVSRAHLRNRVRAELLPMWRARAAEAGRDALAGLALTRELLEEDDDALEAWTDRATRIDTRGGLRLAPLRDLPRGVLRRVLRRWMAGTPARTDLNRAGFNGLIDLVAAGRVGAKHSLGAGHFALRRRFALVCVPAEPRGPVGRKERVP